MPIRSLFTTPLYQAELDAPDLLAELGDAVRALATEDRAGRAWSKDKGYRGYTSYASLNDLPRRDPRFADLVRLLDRHVATFARACAFDLAGRKLKLDSLARTPGAPFTLAMPPDGRPLPVPGNVSAFARVVEYRCEALGAFDGPDGEMCSQGRSEWCLIDVVTRRPVRVPEWMERMFSERLAD